ncbi:protein NYNRIN-like [Gossypium australe]|uniref:Protein NYNRIN-like n=1 Tax=Gossypium australe TaxID=47621 RepID=A0A5B6WQU6_9ROSI|nr:protein NYNRIN-like [Gossypium australe]
MKEVPTKVDTMERITKWSIKLVEFGIDFTLRTAIKGQVLANFMVEYSFERSENMTGNIDYKFDASKSEISRGDNYHSSDSHILRKNDTHVAFCTKIAFYCWTPQIVNTPLGIARIIYKPKGWMVYVDCSATKIGSGVGAFVIDLKGNEWQYGLSFGFQTSNNTTKYEGLIFGLQLVRQLGAKNLTIHTDSQLVAKQIHNEYKVREVTLKLYHTMAIQLLVGFDKVKVK